jgi:hypothetical protein
MARRSRSRLFTPGYGWVATHGGVVLPAKTMNAALRAAVAESKRYGAVVHVVSNAKGVAETAATCIPEPPIGRARFVKCHIKPKFKRQAKRSR